MPKLALGFYAEAPYGSKALTDAGNQQRKNVHGVTRKINTLLNEHNAERTFFVLGDYLVQAAAATSREEMLKVLEPNNPLVDIAQHTYNHVTVADITTRPDKTPVSQKVLIGEINRTQDAIKKILGVEAIGLGTPLGYAGGLQESVVKTINGTGIQYISSDLRNGTCGLNPQLQDEQDQLRQPYFYSDSHLIEIPSHGWQDTAFTGQSKTTKTKGFPNNKVDILSHYLDFLQQAQHIEQSEENTTLTIALCLHPWAITQYDPDLTVLTGLIQFCQKNNIPIISYRIVMEDLKANIEK